MYTKTYNIESLISHFKQTKKMAFLLKKLGGYIASYFYQAQDESVRTSKGGADALQEAQVQLARDQNNININQVSKGTYHGKYLRAVETIVKNFAQKPDEFNPLQIYNYVTDLKVHAKESASDTVVVYGSVPLPQNFSNEITHNDQNTLKHIAMKISYPVLGVDNNSLVVERQILRQVFRELLEFKHSPNVIAFYRDTNAKGRLQFGSGNQETPVLNAFCQKTGRKEIKPVQSVYDREIAKLLDPNICLKNTHKRSVKTDLECNILTMEYIPTGTLGNLLDSILKESMPTFLETDFISILFQVYHALACFARKGVRHNDLHLDNILIKILDKPEEFVLTFPILSQNHGVELSRNYEQKISTRYLVKIYDMDRGTVYNPMINRNMTDDTKFCNWFGECNVPSEKYDVGGFNMGVLKQFWNRTKFIAIKNPHLFNVIDEIYTMIRDQFISIYNFNAFVNEYSQLWMQHIEHPKYDAQRIALVYSPVQCLNALYLKYAGKLQAITSSDQNLDRYTLPERLKLHLGHPRIELLGSDYYRGVTQENLPQRQYTRHISNAAFQKLLSVMKTRNEQIKNSWVSLIQTWEDEFKVDNEFLTPTQVQQRLFNWVEASSILLNEFGAKTGRIFDTNDFALAILALTSPMYYGCSAETREELLNNWSTLSNDNLKFDRSGNVVIDRTGASQIKSYELLIWNTFQGVLPINILQLYNLHPRLHSNINNNNNNNIAPKPQVAKFIPLQTVQEEEKKKQEAPKVQPNQQKPIAAPKVEKFQAVQQPLQQQPVERQLRNRRLEQPNLEIQNMAIPVKVAAQEYKQIGARNRRNRNVFNAPI